MRVAQLQDDLEKRNNIIKRITQENRKLQVCSEMQTSRSYFSCSNSPIFLPFSGRVERGQEEESEIACAEF